MNFKSLYIFMFFSFLVGCSTVEEIEEEFTEEEEEEGIEGENNLKLDIDWKNICSGP